MKNHFLVILTLLLVSCSAQNQSIMQKQTFTHDNSMFPSAKKDQIKHVIEVEKQTNESDFLVEVYIGKTMTVDCNRHNLGAKIIKKHLNGWGYFYYEFETNGNMTSTRMLCNKPKTEKFIKSQAEKLRYNSRLPLVIYTPLGYEIRYKIWKKTPQEYIAKKIEN